MILILLSTDLQTPALLRWRFSSLTVRHFCFNCLIKEVRTYIMDVKQLLFHLMPRTVLRHEDAFMKQLAEILKLMLGDRNSPFLQMDTFFFLLLSPTATSVALFKLSLLLLPRVPIPAHGPSDAYLTCCTKPSLHISDTGAGSRTLLTSTIRCKWRPSVKLPLRQCLAFLLLSHFHLTHFRPMQTPETL